MVDILPVKMLSHREVMLRVADRCKRLRLDHLNWTRAHLARKSRVTASTIKRFENTGQITMENLVLLAMAMNSHEAILHLFSMPQTGSIAEVEKREVRRQRASRSKQ